MNTLTPEPYRANNCAGMALFFEEGLKGGCDQYGPEFARRAQASATLRSRGEDHEISVERTRTSVGWTQAAQTEYRVVLKTENGEPQAMAFSANTLPADLNRELVAKLAHIFPDFPTPAELI